MPVDVGILLQIGAALTVLAAVVWLRFRWRKDINLPPGPWGIPLIGYVPFLGRNLHAMFWELSKTYGPIVR